MTTSGRQEKGLHSQKRYRYSPYLLMFRVLLNGHGMKTGTHRYLLGRFILLKWRLALGPKQKIDTCTTFLQQNDGWHASDAALRYLDREIERDEAEFGV